MAHEVEGPSLEYRRLRAPQDDFGLLVEPPWEGVAATVERNLHLGAFCRQRGDEACPGNAACLVAGTPLVELRELARRELLEAARRWTGSYRKLTEDGEARGTGIQGRPGGDWVPLFLAGHQPQLIHPGVWFKNMALSHLARLHGATAINLIIDSDTPKTTSIRVPTGVPGALQTELVAFDRPGSGEAYEQRRVLDEELFRSFGRRVSTATAGLVDQPLIREFWPEVVRRWEATGNAGAAVAQARHQCEARYGGETLEVPQSSVCETQAFRRFLAHLLEDLPRFRQIHNEVLHEYRRLHRLRNRAQPVPDLAADGDWLEAPLWMWSKTAPRRRRVFVRRDAAALTVSDRAGLEFSVPLHNPGSAVATLSEAADRGVRLRSRALVTTLWARLALSDLFIHGIGGAKYDQLTDLLIARYFGREVPGYLVVSATLHLPLGTETAAVDDRRHLQQQLRELDYHPEEHLDWHEIERAGVAGTVEEQVELKRAWIATEQTQENARRRCRGIRSVNAALQPWVESRRRRLRELGRESEAALANRAVATWREYAFCLYPAAILENFFEQLLPKDD
ncbi:MAG: hypothetical protein ACOY3P_02145 [Planctomycetota bacterium]